MHKCMTMAYFWMNTSFTSSSHEIRYKTTNRPLLPSCRYPTSSSSAAAAALSHLLWIFQSNFISGMATKSARQDGRRRRAGSMQAPSSMERFVTLRPPRSCTVSYKRDKFRTLLIKLYCIWDFDPFYPHFIKNAS